MVRNLPPFHLKFWRFKFHWVIKHTNKTHTHIHIPTHKHIHSGDAPKPEHLDVYEESPTSAVLTWKVNDKSLTMSSPKKQKHGSMNEDEFSDISWKIEVDSVGTGKWIEYEVEVEQSNKSKNQFSATVEDLEAAKSHNFRITSQNSFGSVSVSDVVSLTLSDGIPETPNVSVEKVTSTSVELKWKNILTDKTSGGKRGSKRDSQDLSAAADSNQIGYQIFHDNGSKGQQWVEADDEAEIGKNNTSIVVNGLSPNTEYKFKVVAVNTFGESAPPSKFPSAKTPSCNSIFFLLLPIHHFFFFFSFSIVF